MQQLGYKVLYADICNARTYFKKIEQIEQRRKIGAFEFKRLNF